MHAASVYTKFASAEYVFDEWPYGNVKSFKAEHSQIYQTLSICLNDDYMLLFAAQESNISDEEGVWLSYD